MNIIHITPTLGCGGAEVLMGNIVLEQVKRGDVVKIIILEPFHPTYPNYFLRAQLEKAVSINKIDIEVSFSFIKNKIEMNIDAFDELVNEFKPDVIHSHLYKAEIISRYKLYDNVIYITHCHNNMSQFNFCEEKTLKRKLTDYLESRWLLKRYKKCNNVFVAISKDTQNFFIKHLPLNFKKNVFLLDNCIDTSYYYSKRIQDEVNQIKLITIGNLTSNKGHEFLIDVVCKLKQLKYSVTLDILGYGPLEKHLKQKINSLNLNDCIILKGNVSNVNDYLSDSDIYIHGAFKEGFGLVLVEAMASKLPVVSTNGGGNKDLIQNGYNGFMIESRELDEYVDKIRYLIDNLDERMKMGENAFLFSRNFDIVPYVTHLQKLYLQS